MTAMTLLNIIIVIGHNDDNCYMFVIDHNGGSNNMGESWLFGWKL